ncbi:MAG TPA: DNA-formamidopyrimidine glycosylase family protein [Actinomycetota bacterium]
MPEGDTVYLSATNLRRALAGHRLTRTDLRTPHAAAADLAGQVVTEVVPRGKHMLFRTDGGMTIHSHLRLDGMWYLYAAGRRPPFPAHEIRAIVATAQWQAVGVLLGVVEVLPTAREADVVGHLGPDPLGPDWDTDEALRRLRERPERELGDVLLDQRVIAGFGNAYKNEICYLAGCHPWTRVSEVADLRSLVDVGRRALLANRTIGRWVTTGNLAPGQGQWVFERAGKPCRRCGTPVERTKQNGNGYQRWTYWCPSCQPGAPTAGLARPNRTPPRLTRRRA